LITEANRNAERLSIIPARGSARRDVHSRERRARAFIPKTARQQNLAFIATATLRELSILNGSPRAASVEAASDCRLLALDPDTVRESETPVPGVRQADGDVSRNTSPNGRRRAAYFATEMLPAEVAANDKVGVD